MPALGSGAGEPFVARLESLMTVGGYENPHLVGSSIELEGGEDVGVVAASRYGVLVAVFDVVHVQSG